MIVFTFHRSKKKVHKQRLAMSLCDAFRPCSAQAKLTWTQNFFKSFMGTQYNWVRVMPNVQATKDSTV